MSRPNPLLTVHALGHRITVVPNPAGQPCYDVECSCDVFAGDLCRGLTDAMQAAFEHAALATHAALQP